MKDKPNETPQESKRPEDASDEQLKDVTGGRYQDEHGRYREGMWEGHHYHNGYRGRWESGVWINL